MLVTAYLVCNEPFHFIYKVIYSLTILPLPIFFLCSSFSSCVFFLLQNPQEPLHWFGRRLQFLFIQPVLVSYDLVLIWLRQFNVVDFANNLRAFQRIESFRHTIVPPRCNVIVKNLVQFFTFKIVIVKSQADTFLRLPQTKQLLENI